MILQFLLVCENQRCASTFGGPGDGWPADVDPAAVRDEALDMGWVLFQRHTDESLFCTPKCAAQWIKDNQ